jgi:pimeloyl-ACP methyl ester carboxylesterase
MVRVRTQVVVVAPGSATSTFRHVLEALDAPIDTLFKDMEVTADDWPQFNWSLQMEVEALEAVTSRARLGEFHLVGYSGGAAVALAFVASHGDRVRTLTLIEPPWVGNDDWGPSETAFWEAYDGAMALADAEAALEAFAVVMRGPGVSGPSISPRDGSQRVLFASRLRVVGIGYRRAVLDRTVLRSFDRPVYLPVGGRSTPRMSAAAALLVESFPAAQIEVYDDCDHFDLVTKAVERLALALASLWARGDRSFPSSTV